MMPFLTRWQRHCCPASLTKRKPKEKKKNEFSDTNWLFFRNLFFWKNTKIKVSRTYTELVWSTRWRPGGEVLESCQTLLVSPLSWDDRRSLEAVKQTIWAGGQMFVRSAVRSRGFGVALNTFLQGWNPHLSCVKGDFRSDWKVEVKNHQRKKKSTSIPLSLWYQFLKR